MYKIACNAVEEMTERTFNKLNGRIFDGKLPVPDILVSDVYKKMWINKPYERYHFAVGLNVVGMDFNSYISGVLHEMVHLSNMVNGVSDTSNGDYYHNGLFKKEAELRGLVVKRDGAYGYSKVSLSDEIMTVCATEGIESDFSMCCDSLRHVDMLMDMEAEKRINNNGHYKKYVCSKCGMIVRATRSVRLMCADCGVILRTDAESADNNIPAQNDKRTIHIDEKEFENLPDDMPMEDLLKLFN